MFNYFKKNKTRVDIESVLIPNFGWNKIQEDLSVIKWVNPEEDTIISLNFFNMAPDLPTVKNLNEIKNFYRNSISAAGGGIIEVDLLSIHDIPSVKTIFKIPQKENGMIYIASITIPFEDCSFVAKIQSNEIGMAGIRESIILERLLKNGEVSIEKENIENWFADPYRSDFKEGTPMNLSEHEKYDPEFPKHSLTIARALIDTMMKETSFNPEIKTLLPFNK